MIGIVSLYSANCVIVLIYSYLVIVHEEFANNDCCRGVSYLVSGRRQWLWLYHRICANMQNGHSYSLSSRRNLWIKFELRLQTNRPHSNVRYAVRQKIERPIVNQRIEAR